MTKAYCFVVQVTIQCCFQHLCVLISDKFTNTIYGWLKQLLDLHVFSLCWLRFSSASSLRLLKGNGTSNKFHRWFHSRNQVSYQKSDIPNSFYGFDFLLFVLRLRSALSLRHSSVVIYSHYFTFRWNRSKKNVSFLKAKNGFIGIFMGSFTRSLFICHRVSERKTKN